jgi:hypothetical protein
MGANTTRTNEEPDDPRYAMAREQPLRSNQRRRLLLGGGKRIEYILPFLSVVQPNAIAQNLSSFFLVMIEGVLKTETR